MKIKLFRAAQPGGITDNGIEWTRPTAKPKPGSRPVPTPGQLGK
jgi:hypothetical protein